MAGVSFKRLGISKKMHTPLLIKFDGECYMTTSNVPKSRNLTIFLLKEGITKPLDIFSDIDVLKKYDVIQDNSRIGELYLKPSLKRLPNWLSLFENALDISELDLVNSSTAAVLIIGKKGSTFAVTFGYGRSLLEPSVYEERFGLLVTLNSIDPEKIRRIDKKCFDSIDRHSIEQASKDVAAGDFGINIEQDLLQAVTGKPLNDDLGTRLTGKDALNVSIKINLPDIPNKLEEYYRKFNDNTYKKYFDWIDQIGEISNKDLINILDSLLMEKINKSDFNQMWLAVPHIIDWVRVGGFKYSRSVKADLYDDVHFDKFIKCLRNNNDVRIKTLKNRKIFCISAISDQVIWSWPVYKCVYCEIEHDGDQFLLSEGKWYRIEGNFVKKINHEFHKIPFSKLSLPEYTGGSELEYNRTVYHGNRDKFHLMDGDVIEYGGGHSKIEFCDLYTIDKEIVHIKKYGSSSVFSHLFNQALVSADLTYLDVEFRKLVNNKLPKKFRFSNVNDRLKTSNYEVILAVISHSDKKFTLPFFSKISLTHVARRIMGYGYKVSLLKIPSTGSK